MFARLIKALSVFEIDARIEAKRMGACAESHVLNSVATQCMLLRMTLEGAQMTVGRGVDGPTDGA